jgi:hypothetical protein
LRERLYPAVRFLRTPDLRNRILRNFLPKTVQKTLPNHLLKTLLFPILPKKAPVQVY